MKQQYLVCIFLFLCLSVRIDAGNAVDVKHPVKSKNFTFAIIADPQVSSRGYQKQEFINAWQTLEKMSQEIGSSEKKVAFTVSLGDIVNAFEPRSLENFTECIKGLNTPLYLVHGNHDSKFPYTEYRRFSRELTGIDEMYYSFDAGNWHFIVTPSQIDNRTVLMKNPDYKKYVNEFTEWLKKDLAANKNRPTAVFQHFHGIPIGLTQLEWYTVTRERRKELMDILSEHGNVKYYFNGHIHNGINPSVKMTKTYRGITFVTVPTGIVTRPLQDEFPEYRSGDETGGYYMTVDVKGDEFTLYGHLAGNPEAYEYPKSFEVIDETIEPRWFHNLPELESVPQLINGSFEDGMSGWNKVYRYNGDYFSAFVAKPENMAGQNCALVGVRAAQPDLWGNDEFNEIYQIVDVKDMHSLQLKAGLYLTDLPENGGVFLRAVAMNGKGHCCTVFLRLGRSSEYRASFIPRAMDYEMNGTPAKWGYLKGLAEKKKIVFLDIPEKTGEWIPVDIDLAEVYDAAVGEMGAFSRMNVEKIYLGLAAWANKESGSESMVYYSGVSLLDSGYSSMTIDGKPVSYESAFQCDFGNQVEEKMIRKRMKNKK
ncbi:MAG: metallophosphoesterase family protein [Candidatus Cryptobacteroides sp.]